MHAAGGDVAFTFLPSDLIGSGSERIDRSHVTLIGATSIPSGSYAIDTVKVSGSTDPGTYDGKITLAFAGQSIDVPVTVIANERPALAAPAGSQLKLDVTRCGGEFSCWIAGWLVPDGGQDASTSVLVTNSGKADDAVIAAQVFATGSVGGHTLAAPLDWKSVVAAGTTKALPLTVQRRQLPPDHYSGSAFVTVKDSTGLLTIPVDVSVRSGPLWAILALLLGIVVGRLAVHMQSKGNQQTTYLWQLNALRAQAERRLADHDDRAALAARINAALAAIYAFEFDGLPAVLTAIGTAIDTLAHMEDVDRQLLAETDPPPQAAQLMTSVRDAIRAGQYDQAVTHVGELEALLAAAPAPAHPVPVAPAAGPPFAPAIAGPALRMNVHMLGERLDLLSAAATQGAGDHLNRAQKWLAGGSHLARRFFLWLAGIGPEAAADARLWVIRPLLAVILILLLVGLGLKTLYVGNNSFGSGGFSDYFGLVLWGLSADVAARTLTTLGGTTAPAAVTPKV